MRKRTQAMFVFRFRTTQALSVQEASDAFGSHQFHQQQHPQANTGMHACCQVLTLPVRGRVAGAPSVASIPTDLSCRSSHVRRGSRATCSSAVMGSRKGHGGALSWDRMDGVVQL
jgi:hypothetical protein